MAGLRRMHPSELDTCACHIVLNAVFLPDEDLPRCFECCKPIRRTGSAAPHLRWLLLAVLFLAATERDACAYERDT